ncbi:MAG: acyl-ACP--UDP-N-acetylglucosamine O-acyltransferase [Alphaproteobacteria bacterium]|nr:acyl-ACP--UDP-N-acetylglucosamine O-acyltransferase [Alphaproteobacteria bacterium]
MNTSQIHPTAIIEDGAIIGDGTFVGPYCCIGPKVKLGKDCRLISHVSLAGDITIGDRATIYPFASLGHPPQDLKYHGEASSTIIGTDATIREYVTIHPGTETGCMLTEVGDHCLLMVGAHIAHDCRVGNHVILANNVALAGHVTVEDHAIIGGLSAVHQFVRIGKHAIIGGMSAVEKDVIPYGTVMGERASLQGLNIIGLRRRGFSAKSIQQLMNIYTQLFGVNQDETLAKRIEKLSLDSHHYGPEVLYLIDFIKADSKRPLCLPKLA